MLAPRAAALAVTGALVTVSATAIATRHWQLATLAAGLTLIFLAGLLLLAARFGRLADLRHLSRLEALLAEDAAPCFGTDGDGTVTYQNRAASTRFGNLSGATLARTLGDSFAEPGATLYRLQMRARHAGAAREDVVTRRGHLRLSVHRTGADHFLWRLEEMLEHSGPARGAESLSLPVLIASKSGTVLFMNEALRRLLGTRPKHLDHVFRRPPDAAGGAAEIIGADGPLEAWVAEIEGIAERRELYLLPAPPDAGARPTLSPDRFQELPVALALIAPGGHVEQANRLARDLLGIAAGARPGFPELVDGLGRPIADWLEDARAGRSPGKAEVLRVRRPDQDAYLQVALRRDPSGPGLIAVLNDATEFKTLEAQVVQSQKMEAIGHLAGGVAHDFNNLLTAISGHCDLLLLRHGKDDPDYADLVQIHQNTNRAASLVSQLLAFSRKQVRMPEELDFGEVMADLVHLLNRLLGEKTALHYSQDTGLGTIRADKRQFEQVLMNLVVNARDAMPEGGTIALRATNSTLRQDLRRDRATVPAGDYVLLQVRDQGIGIAPERLPRIFEPFYTTKRAGEGTGLGLSTVYGIVKQSGGFIFVDSAVGEGTTFSLYFPVHSRPAARREVTDLGSFLPAGFGPAAGPQRRRPDGAEEVVETPPEPAPSPGGPGAAGGDGADAAVVAALQAALGPAGNGLARSAPTDSALLAAEPTRRPSSAPAVKPLGQGDAGVILLVEDEAPVRAFAARALRMRGYTVLEAGSAEEALDILEAEELRVDVFVTDVVMPGMDGPSWVREALKRRPAVRVVFISGYAEESFSETRARIPNSVFLPKPFSLGELTATVQGQIH